MSGRRKARRRVRRRLKIDAKTSYPWWVIASVVLVVALVAASRILR